MTPRMIIRDAERKFVIEFIRLYKDLPALWDTKSKAYHLLPKKNLAYDVLVAKFKEFFPKGTKDDVRKKINALRSSYRKELRKHLKSLATGDVYHPSLFYFHEFDFLRELNQSNCADDSLKDDSESVEVSGRQQSDSECSMEAEYLEKVEVSDDEQNSDTEVHVTTWDLEGSSVQEPATATVKRRRTEGNNNSMTEGKLILAAEDVSYKKDEYYYWAISCAADLRKMNSTQQLFAKKAISDILMEGQLGQLNRNSVKINENSDVIEMKPILNGFNQSN